MRSVGSWEGAAPPCMEAPSSTLKEGWGTGGLGAFGLNSTERGPAGRDTGVFSREARGLRVSRKGLDFSPGGGREEGEESSRNDSVTSNALRGDFRPSG